jgi:tRNA threonylcarbamoyladenosine biosynthesis protein TsaB
MSTILAIETSAEIASVALLHDGVMTADQASGVATHSQTLLPMVQALLANAGVLLSDCDAIAFGAGPGSFTGVRTACGIAQGLAYGAQRPLLPIVTLLAMAQNCREQTGADNIVAILDARMGEIYWAQYRFENEWRIVIPPTLSAPQSVAPSGHVTVCGNGLKAYAAAFESYRFAASGMDDLIPHAKQIALLGSAAFAQGLGVAARDAEPLYLRNKVALTTSERVEKAAREAA